MGMQAMSMSPQENPLAAAAVGGTTGGTFTLWTSSGWAKLISSWVTYVSGVASTPTPSLQVVDAAGNILWKFTGAALTASTTSTIGFGEGVQSSIATPAAQYFPLPTDMVVPPGGKLQLVLTGTTVAADTYAANTLYSN